MRVKFHATGTELNMSRDEGAPFIAAGLAVEVVNADTPAPKAEPQGVFFSIGRGNDGVPMLFWRTSGPGQNARGGAYTFKAAQEMVVYFSGKPHRPSPELINKLRAALGQGDQPVHASTPVFAAIQSSGNLLLDTVTASLGKRPNDHIASTICKGGDDGSKAACDAIYPPKY